MPDPFGELAIPVVADLGPFERTVRRDLKRRAESAGDAAGKATGDALMDRLERQLRQRVGDAKEALARGLIDRRQFEKAGNEAAEAYNKGILEEIERLGKSGKLTQAQFLDLTDKLKTTGDVGARSMNRLGRGIQTVGGILAAVGIGVIIDRIVRGLRAVLRISNAILQRGGTFQQLREGFVDLTTSAGLSPARTLDELRRALRGSVRDVELFRLANVALQAELPVTEEQMGRLAEVSRRIGRTLGLDAEEAFSRFTRGIAKNETEILDELGILTRLQNVLRDWEDQTGKNSDELDAQAKTLLFFNAVVEEAERKVALLGEEQLSARERVAQLSAAWENLKDRSAAAIAESPRLSAFLVGIGEDAAGSAGKVQDLANRVGALFDTILDLGAQIKGEEGTFRGRIFTGLLTQPGQPLAPLAQGVRGLADLGREEFQANLARREAETARTRRLEEISALTDIQEIRDQLRENHEREIELLDSESVSVKQTNQLYEERKALLAALSGALGGTGDGDGTTPPSASDIAAASRSAAEVGERFRAAQIAGEALLRNVNQPLRGVLTEILSLEQEIAGLEQTRALLGEQFPADAQRYLEALQAQADVLREQAREMALFQGMENPVVELAESIQDGIREIVPFREEIERAAGAAEALADAETLLAAARAAGDPEQIAAAEERVSRAREHAQSVLRDVLGDLRESGAESEQILALWEAIVAALEAAGIEVDSLTESQEDWREIASTVEGVARGVLSIADAMGVLDDETRKVLEGITNIAAGVGRIAGGDVLGGSVQAIGGLINVVSGLVGDDENADIIQRNTEALERLALELSNFHITPEFVDDAVAAIEDFLEGASAIEDFFSGELETGSLTPNQRLDAVLRQHGLTMAQLRALAEQAGLQIFGPSGSVVPEALEQLLKFIELGGGAGIIAGGKAETRLAVNITEAQANQLLAFQATQVHHLAGIHALLAGGAPISPAAAAAPPASALTSISIGDIHVALTADGLSPANARDVGREVGAGIDDGLRRRMGAGARGQGALGIGRVRIDAPGTPSR